MQRRHFIKLFWAGTLGAVGLGLSGCEAYDSSVRAGRYDYDYYPESDVYYHSWTGAYFYFGNGIWIRSRTLPIHIVLNRSYRRRIYITDRYPYSRNREHRRTFPPRTRRPSPGDQVIRRRNQDARERRQEEQRDRAARQRRQEEQRDRAPRQRRREEQRVQAERERRQEGQRDRAKRKRRLEEQRKRDRAKRQEGQWGPQSESTR